jgi:flagellar FliL protein
VNKLPTYIAAGAAALLMVVGISGGAAYLVMKSVQPAKAEAATASPATATINLAQGGKVITLKPFVTNLADADRPRYINVTFELVALSDKEAQTLQQNLPVLRDSIVGILNTKKSMEVSGEAGANKLKSDIQEKLNGLLGGRYVQRVLMTDFTVQF